MSIIQNLALMLGIILTKRRKSISLETDFNLIVFYMHFTFCTQPSKQLDTQTNLGSGVLLEGKVDL